MPVFWKNKILLAKIETAYGTDAAPTGAANAVLATDVTLSPMEGNDVARNLDLPWFGSQGSVAVDLHAKLSFKVELAPSGTKGTPPAWGPLLRACGMAEVIVANTSVTYNPISSGFESLSLHLWVGATQYKLSGARGTCTLRLGASAIPYLEFEFTGLFSQPAEGARPTPTLTSWKAPRVASTLNTPTFTIAGTPMVLRSFALAMGNAIEPRFLIGSEAVLITDHAETIEATVEAVPLTTFNPYALAATGSTVAVSLVHGTTAGAIATIAAPAAQMQRPAGLENAQNIVEWPLRLVPTPTAGNDQWTLALT
uniref:Uncharacterized protein n=1 Tax=Cereibacter sphaeroides (strain ATCC 17025 / ATH 2.4.3) TaxID=349102 RepID=A4WS45_CERS5